MGSDTLTEPILSEEETEEGNVPEDTDKKPLYPTATVALGTIPYNTILYLKWETCLARIASLQMFH